MAHRVITTRWLHIHKNVQFVINHYLWPLNYPRANKSPNLLLQKCKKQHLDKLKEIKTPWVLDGASNSGHSTIAYPKFRYFFQLNEMRDEAKTWRLVSGSDVASSHFFKKKSELHLKSRDSHWYRQPLLNESTHATPTRAKALWKLYKNNASHARCVFLM